MRTFEIKAEKIETLKDERSIVHYISTSDLDRGDDIVNPKGMDDKDFAKSPSVWYNHNYVWNPDALPIGKSLWRKKKENGVLAKTQFAKTEFADDIYYLHENDFIRSWSIGWDVKKKNGKPVEGAIEYDEKTNVTHINMWSLIEYSSAPIAMNPNALDEAKNLIKSMKSYPAKKALEESFQVYRINEAIKEFTKEINFLKDITGKLKDDITITQKDFADLTNLLNEKKIDITKQIKVEIPDADLGFVKRAVKNALRN